MANGQLPGSVAPTSIGQGKSYSEMVADQLGLIQRQRAVNLQQRLAQDEKNREFRTEQLQNVYDFDVSGLASGDAALLGQLQKQLASSLNPDSETAYSNSQELVADISFINNVYNEMKRWGETGTQGRQSYQQGVLQPDRGDGTVFVGDENTLKSRNDVWEQGAFANAQILGNAGQRQIVGDMLDQDGNVMQEGVDFFQNPWRNQPDQFWRQEIAEAAFMDVAGTYADNTNLDLTNVDQKAANDWDNNPVKIQEKYRRDKARRNGLSMDDITNDNTTFQDGYTDEDLRSEYIDEARRGVSELRKQVQVPGAFVGTVFDTQFGVRAIGLREAMPVNTSAIRGDVTHVGFSGDEMVVVYDDPEGEQNQIKVSENSDVWASILNQAGGLAALKDMIGAENVEGGEAEGEVGEKPKVDETLEGRQKALEEEVSSLEASKIELERRLEDAQDALSLAQNTRSGSQVQQAQINAALSEVKTLSEQLDQVNADIQRKAQVGPEVPEEYRTPSTIKGEGENISYKRPGKADEGKLIVGDASQGSTYNQRRTSFEEASRLAKEAGHPFPEVVAAQFALESAYGKKPTGNYNFFGLKASNTMLERLRNAGIDASVAEGVPTTEQDATGKERNIKANFLSFKSPEDAFMAYLMFIDTTKSDGERRYAEALDRANTAKEYLQKIKESGYATAKDYVSSVDSIASGFGVDLDNISRNDDRLASN